MKFNAIFWASAYSVWRRASDGARLEHRAARLRLWNRRNPLARSSSQTARRVRRSGGAPQARRPRSPSGLRARRPSWLRSRDLWPVRRARLARARRARIMWGDRRENGRRRRGRRGDRPAHLSFALRRHAGRELRAAQRRDAGSRTVALSDRERFDLVARPYGPARIMGTRPNWRDGPSWENGPYSRRRRVFRSRRLQGRRFSDRRAKRGWYRSRRRRQARTRCVFAARSHPRSVARSGSPDADRRGRPGGRRRRVAARRARCTTPSVAQRPHFDRRRSGRCQRMAPPNDGRLRQSAKAVRQNDRFFSGRQTSAGRRDDGDRSRPFTSLQRRLRDRRGATRRRSVGAHGEERRQRCGSVYLGASGATARRDRIHLGLRRAFFLQEKPAQPSAVRRRRSSTSEIGRTCSSARFTAEPSGRLLRWRK